MPYPADKLRSLLAENERLLRHCDDVDKQVKVAAQHELGRIAQRLASLPPGKVVRDGALAALYRSLVAERGRLSSLLA